MKPKFFIPKAPNILVTLFVLFLPLIRESAPLETGGEVVTYYSPMFLLSAYSLMNDYYPFFLMVGFSLAVYLVVSLLILFASIFFRRRK